MEHPDSWLFLPPEVESLVPGLLARVTGTGAGTSSDGSREKDERDRIELLVVEGDAEAWRHYLRTTVADLQLYADSRDDDALQTLIAILDDQFILARAITDPEPEDVAARAELARLIRV